MELAEKKELLDASLIRAAEQAGDITGPAIDLYYRRYPAAKAVFERLGVGGKAQLEGQMVENTLYCLMYWFECPGEIEILLSDSVPHHHDTLEISLDWYNGLIEAVADVIVDTIPAENLAEKAVWDELRTELCAIIENCREHFFRTPLQNLPDCADNPAGCYSLLR